MFNPYFTFLVILSPLMLKVMLVFSSYINHKLLGVVFFDIDVFLYWIIVLSNFLESIFQCLYTKYGKKI